MRWNGIWLVEFLLIFFSLLLLSSVYSHSSSSPFMFVFRFCFVTGEIIWWRRKMEARSQKVNIWLSMSITNPWILCNVILATRSLFSTNISVSCLLVEKSKQWDQIREKGSLFLFAIFAISNSGHGSIPSRFHLLNLNQKFIEIVQVVLKQSKSTEREEDMIIKWYMKWDEMRWYICTLCLFWNWDCKWNHFRIGMNVWLSCDLIWPGWLWLWLGIWHALIYLLEFSFQSLIISIWKRSEWK